ncbi:hypothetical protein HK102_002531, partial [Quaeritorhiza haematococci]
AFVKFYLGIGSHLKNEAWVESEAPDGAYDATLYPELVATERAVSLGTADPTGTMTSSLNYTASKSSGSRFRRGSKEAPTGKNGKPIDTGNSGKPALSPEAREEKFEAFVEAWRQFFVASAKVLHNLHGDAINLAAGASKDGQAKNVRKGDFGDAIFAHFKNAPTIWELDEDAVVWVKALIRAIAHTVDNILDDYDWRTKGQALFNRLPVTLIVTSLRLVNPIPFMERMIKVFLWRPAGVQSLLQILGGTVCAHDKTVKAIKNYKSNVPSSDRSAIEKAVEAMWSPKKKNAQADAGKKLFSSDSNSAFLEFLSRKANISPSTLQKESDAMIRITYARLLIRRKEKDEFINMLGDPGITKFIIHVCHVIPPLLTEVYQCINFADLAATFFQSIGDILKALQEYDKAYNGKGQQPDWQLIIDQIEKAIIPIFEQGYPVVYEMARKDKTDTNIYEMLDWFLREMGGSEDGDLAFGRTAVLDMAPDAQCVLDKLSEEEVKRLWREVDEIIKLTETGVEETEWPKFELLQGKALDIFLKEMEIQFGGSATARA